MPVSTHTFIRAIIDAENLRGSDPHHAQRCAGCVITISRTRGTGGEEIARQLADRLNLPLFDRALVEAIARESGIDPEELARMDETVRGLRSSWMELLWTNKPERQSKYQKNLINTILGVSRTGGVVVGRGANFILGPRRALRVRVVGSLETRVAYLMRHHNMTRESALADIAEADREREGFVTALFGKDPADPTNYDLVINVDRFSEHMAVDLILEALHLTAPREMHAGTAHR